MPLDAAAVRGRAALAGLGLILASMVLAYLNSTTNIHFWSLMYVVGVAICAVAAASSFATALGITHGLAKAGAYVTSWVPFVALYFVGIQALHYAHDGLDGFMAGISILTLIFLAAFGVFDAIGVLFGNALHTVQESAAEASARMDAAASALATKQRQDGRDQRSAQY